MLKRLLNFDGKVYNINANGQFWKHEAGVTSLSYLGGSHTIQVDTMTDPGGVWFAALQAEAVDVLTDPIENMLNYDGRVYNVEANGQFFRHDAATETTYLHYLGGAGTIQMDPMADPGGAWFAALQASAITL